MIASIFSGPGDRLNMVPMNGNFNTGAWKSVENKLAVALKAGKSVEVKIDVRYGTVGVRPDGFVVTRVVDGGRLGRDVFLNTPGGK